MIDQTFILAVLGMAAVLLVQIFVINKRTHWPVAMMNTAFSFILILMIPWVVTEYNDTCDVVLTNSTRTFLDSANFTDAHTYDEQCFTSTKTSPSTFVQITMYYIYFMAAYWFIKLFIWVVKENFMDNTTKMIQQMRLRFKRR